MFTVFLLFYVSMQETKRTKLDFRLKGNAQFIFLCNPKKSLVNVRLMEILKSTVTKKVIVFF